MGNVEIPKWLEDLPLAPEFHPTDTEFADPIAYISKIEKKASAFGICKIIPPLPRPSKRYVFGNLNKSLSKCPELGDGVNLSNGCSSLKMDLVDSDNDGEVRAVFTTRRQELGQSMRKTKGVIKENPQLGVHKQVWQSGEIYTLEQFESKSKAFARSLLGMLKEVNPSIIEALFWKADSEKPIYVEYANDVPGSGFGEPEGQFRYFHKRRRKRASYKSYRRSAEGSDCEKNVTDNVNNSSIGVVKDASIKSEPSTSSGMIPKSSITSTLEETLRSTKRKSLNESKDVEGTAGWKLSNCPWNLQVIARSPGSITRFMPDDIPGVTSPMLYIGMLFSWFAWHVEDHELHSMNFLHTGSPKTWYSVPGDYAFAFEEVIRNEAYGGNIDRLAALTLLGEKTTLLSPEVVVSASIPCCRLIQNPGEFVVTFPRAYHVGFSHGFNCGEAANFGTPQWLKVAKEAAIRRAAMNYLPMLSHQQLLYLLTMSFVLRVPRSLLPGCRSSRLRDRLKEERELSVKKAFIEDMLRENSTLSILISKDSTYNVVIWNPDLLPCASKESQLPSIISSTSEENASHSHSEDKCNSAENDLLKEMSLYMETLNDLYVDDDDLSCDFQVDSGTLACVACGILGFPFMCVMQPSDGASIEPLPVNHPLLQEGSRVEKSDNFHSSASCDDSVKCSIPDLPMPRGWNNSGKFMRPRVFCLEHGIQIEELLRSKGGANVLIICHSDYQKIKAHATAIAEDIDIPFNYNEIPLESASQEDLNLIYRAIDGEDHDECGEDWTSKMGINLRYCVKVRKNSPSNKVQHALALGGLFSDEGSSSDLLNTKWQSKRLRSRTKLNCSAYDRLHDSVETDKGDSSGKKLNSLVVEKEKIIQYTRRKYKVKTDCSASWGEGCSMQNAEVSVPSCEGFVKHAGKTSKINPCNDDISGGDSAGFGFSLVLHEVQVLETTRDMRSNSAPLHLAGSLLTVADEHVVEDENQRSEESNGCEVVLNAAACGTSDVQHQEQVTSNKTNGSQCIACNDTSINQLAASLEDKYEFPQSCAAEDKLQLEVEIYGGSHGEVLIPGNVIVTNHPNISVDKSSEILKESCTAVNSCNDVAVESVMPQTAVASERKEEPVSYSVTQMEIEQPTTSVEGSPKVIGRILAEKELCTGSTLDSGVLLKISATDRSNAEELAPNSTTQMLDPVSVEEYSEVSRGRCVAGDLSVGVNFDTDLQPEIHLDDKMIRDDVVHELCRTKTNNEEPLSCLVTETYQPNSTRIKKCSGTEESCITENMLKGQEVCSSHELEPKNIKSTVVDPISTSGKSSKRKSELEQITDNKLNCNGFIKSPCEGLRPRAGKEPPNGSRAEVRKSTEDSPGTKKARKSSDVSDPSAKKKETMKRSHKCDIEGCPMSFERKAELLLHKRNQCPHEGCRKRFSSHKYAIIHQRIHEDDRPLKCPWKGCSMSFKWAWARTEHIRVHTGEKPYTCKVDGCGLSFRFVSDFSRHRRKTGHYM